MDKISINLLPKEVLLQRKQSSKFATINTISVAILIILVFLSSATLAMRISQNFQLNEVKNNLTLAEQDVAVFQTKEAQLAFLKKRLEVINNLTNGDVKVKAIFNLILAIIPKDINVSEINVDKSGKMVIMISTTSLSSIETLISDLSSQEKNANLVKEINLDTLSKDKDGVYRLSLNIST